MLAPSRLPRIFAWSVLESLVPRILTINATYLFHEHLTRIGPSLLTGLSHCESRIPWQSMVTSYGDEDRPFLSRNTFVSRLSIMRRRTRMIPSGFELLESRLVLSTTGSPHAMAAIARHSNLHASKAKEPPGALVLAFDEALKGGAR